MKVPYILTPKLPEKWICEFPDGRTQIYVLRLQPEKNHMDRHFLDNHHFYKEQVDYFVVLTKTPCLSHCLREMVLCLVWPVRGQSDFCFWKSRKGWVSHFTTQVL